jgi:hypothetical protein
MEQTQECDDPHYQKMKVYKEVPVCGFIRILIFLELTVTLDLVVSWDFCGHGSSSVGHLLHLQESVALVGPFCSSHLRNRLSTYRWHGKCFPVSLV